MYRLLTVALLLLGVVLLAAPAASAETFSKGTVHFDRVERVVTARSVFEHGSETPRVTYSETLVLAGWETACTFTIECNDNGTFNATFEGCTGAQAKKIFEAAEDIC